MKKPQNIELTTPSHHPCRASRIDKSARWTALLFAIFGEYELSAYFDDLDDKLS